METVYINGKKIRLTKDPSDIISSDTVLINNLNITLDIMNNCLDVIYDLVKTSYPAVYRPGLYLSDDTEVNAFADSNNKRIIINLGLFMGAISLIERYNAETLNKYKILNGQSDLSVRSGIRVHLWRFVILHELYHLWHGHALWKKKYTVNEKGEIIIRTNKSQYSRLPIIISEANKIKQSSVLSRAEIEANITSQAFELDADSSSVCMLINLLFFDMKNRRIEEDKQMNYIKIHLAYIMAGLSSAFCLFDENAGGKFELLDSLEKFTHPIPAIRFVYVEEIADAILQNYLRDEKDLRYVETEWQKIVCDVEADYNGTVDMGQVFFYPAYTEIAQKHLCRLKKRLTDMNSTITEFALGNMAPKLENEDLEYLPEAVWFDRKGKSLRGWINPATGKQLAVRSDRMPVIAGMKIGRNEPCPCGSGKKYKRCCGNINN